jgi:hypothetical protein
VALNKTNKQNKNKTKERKKKKQQSIGSIVLFKSTSQSFAKQTP